MTLSTTRFVPKLLAVALTVAMSASVGSQELGKGGSMVQGSAGPQGAQNANSQLEMCDAPKGTLAVVEPQSHIIASLQRYQLGSPVGVIRMLIEDMLAELGYTVAAAAARLDEAMQVAHEADFDIAILDINLNGEAIAPLADVLAARGLPFVFATGYGAAGIPDSHRDRPTLKKPFQLDHLRHTLQTALADARQPAKRQE